ncbi:helix-turn-helix transcriptional regulator [Streptomyces qinglanensis]|uniref:helix-turn-helix transcriptional regulator n=1 Tax=Streptomyces qinglanensis TaxID=943816 RepID=UPI003D735E75
MPDRTFDGGALRDHRNLERMSQSDLADELNVKVNAVSRWETGKITPPAERLPSIARAVGVELDKLFPRAEPPNLKDLRCDAGLTQADTTKYTGSRSPMALRAAEGGKRPLPERYPEQLAEAYGVTVQELLAAQKRSFGHAVPTVAPATSTSVGSAPSVAHKLAHLRAEVFQGMLPADSEIAAEGNRKAGRALLTADLVGSLRRGVRTEAPDEVLDALALALDVPPVFFHTPDPQIERLVVSTRAVGRHHFTVAAARGGEREIPESVKAELLDFINQTLGDVLGPGADSPQQ